MKDVGDRGRARKRIAALGGQDLDALRRAAQSRDFKPVPLGVKVSHDVQDDVTRAQTANVLGMLPGSDPSARRGARRRTPRTTITSDPQGGKAGETPSTTARVDNASGVAALLSSPRR